MSSIKVMMDMKTSVDLPIDEFKEMFGKRKDTVIIYKDCEIRLKMAKGTSLAYYIVKYSIGDQKFTDTGSICCGVTYDDVLVGKYNPQSKFYTANALLEEAIRNVDQALRAVNSKKNRWK